jgi:FtsZ-binding cell division protein ZapB
MAAILTLSVLEIILLLFGAIILGITIHFFIASNKSLKVTAGELQKNTLAQDEWKLRYFNDMELRDKEISSLKQQLLEAEENANIYSTEAEEMHRQNRKLEAEIANLKKLLAEEPTPPLAAAVEKVKTQEERGDYLEQLRQAQSSLMEHNQKINQLLGNIDIIKEKEEMQREVLRVNDELSAQINAMRLQLTEKEIEISNSKQKEHLTNEMKSMLDNTYTEFNTLQGKILKLESQLTSSRMMNMEYEDLKEAHSKLSRDFEEYKLKANTLTIENQQLQAQLLDVEDRLRDANFQRQQLQKRTAYLEELNTDLQVVSDTNKKLEAQLRRVGELESMLNVVAEERDHLMRNKGQ